jgi:N-acetylmuramoyl-L-alanine amidase
MGRIVETPSPNFEPRLSKVELVVLHYTGMQNAEIALQRLTDPAPIAGKYVMPNAEPVDPQTRLGRVSAHYVVAEDGTVHRLVEEAHRAWHAGAGRWAGRDGLNDRSIGIEIVNGGHDFGLPAFTPMQIDAVIALTADIMARHHLPSFALIGHSDLAPTRKLDPGERFPWAQLARSGLGLWPQTRMEPGAPLLHAGDANPAVAALQEGLQGLGYDVPVDGQFDAQTEAVLLAFQRRYRPARIDGALDADCLARLNDLLAQMMRLSFSRLQS